MDVWSWAVPRATALHCITGTRYSIHPVVRLPSGTSWRIEKKRHIYMPVCYITMWLKFPFNSLLEHVPRYSYTISHIVFCSFLSLFLLYHENSREVILTTMWDCCLYHAESIFWPKAFISVIVFDVPSYRSHNRYKWPVKKTNNYRSPSLFEYTVRMIGRLWFDSIFFL